MADQPSLGRMLVAPILVGAIVLALVAMTKKK